jgi:hypothetical protein
MPLDGVDPCSVITADQRQDLGLSARTDAEAESDALGSPDCLWNSATRGSAESYLVRLITKRGTDYYLDNENPVRVIAVSGFSAVETTSPLRPSDQDHCLVLVDVAAGQTLWTQFDAVASQNPGIRQEVACAHAREGAEAMVATLRSLRKPN